MTATAGGEQGKAWSRDLARLIAAQILLHATMSGTRMSVPLLLLGRGYSKATVGVLLAMFALAQVLVALPAGRLADRHGLKLPFRRGLVAGAVGAAAAALWPSLPVLCLSALLTGGAVAAASVSMQRHIGRAAPDAMRLKQAFSWVSISPAAANSLGPFVAGLLIDAAGYRTAFLVMAALPLASWVCMRGTRDTPVQAVEPAGGDESAWDLWRGLAFRRLMLMNWFMTASWDMHGFMVPVLGHERGLSASVIGTILASFALSAAVIRLAMPWIAARAPEWSIMLCAMSLTALLFGVYPWMTSALAMGVCSAGIGMALATAQPIVMTIIHQMTPVHRHGQAVAMRLMVVNASNVVMPLMYGAAGGVLGGSGIFWLAAVVVGAGSRLALGLREVRQAAPATE